MIPYMAIIVQIPNRSGCKIFIPNVIQKSVLGCVKAPAVRRSQVGQY